jgi:hypothetical protein
MFSGALLRYYNYYNRVISLSLSEQTPTRKRERERERERVDIHSFIRVISLSFVPATEPMFMHLLSAAKVKLDESSLRILSAAAL